MSQDGMSRRDFSKLSLAALGGALAGTMISGCKNTDSESGSGEGSGGAGEKAKHLCRGLNDCKGQGAAGKNDCAGLGGCATVEAHGCGGKNDCKNLGGCKGAAGANECKGKGGCSVPLMDGAWTAVRTKKETEWKAAGKKFGTAPAKS